MKKELEEEDDECEGAAQVDVKQELDVKEELDVKQELEEELDVKEEFGVKQVKHEAVEARGQVKHEAAGSGTPPWEEVEDHEAEGATHPKEEGCEATSPTENDPAVWSDNQLEIALSGAIQYVMAHIDPADISRV